MIFSSRFVHIERLSREDRDKLKKEIESFFDSVPPSERFDKLMEYKMDEHYYTFGLTEYGIPAHPKSLYGQYTPDIEVMVNIPYKYIKVENNELIITF